MTTLTHGGSCRCAACVAYPFDLDALRERYPADTPGIAPGVPELISDDARLRSVIAGLTQARSVTHTDGCAISEVGRCTCRRGVLDGSL